VIRNQKEGLAVDVASVFHDTLSVVVNPPRPNTLISSVPEDKTELPQLHFREVSGCVGTKGQPERSWLVILRDEYGVVHEQIAESLVENRSALEQKFRSLWADLLQNRSKAHMHNLNQSRKEREAEDEMKVEVEEPALPVKEDLELTMHIASETFKTLQNAEVSVEYRGVKVTLRR
jgi:hypothetical protein